MLVVSTSVYGIKFAPPPSRIYPTSPSKSTHYMPPSGGLPTLHWQCGFSQLCRKAKGDNKV